MRPLLSKRLQVSTTLALLAPVSASLAVHDIWAALEADACGSPDGSLGLLQVTATSQDSSTSFWQGVRETGKTCFFSSCPQSLQPVECHHWRCVCQEGFRYSPADGGGCVAEDSVAGRRMTGATCFIKNCPLRTQCLGHECLCYEGFEFKEGKCVRVPGLESKVERSGCEHHPKCAELGLLGECCPNMLGSTLECCA
mmetsp:Transcript_44740/g.104242  ORF Transcript_44740/g.104242 Transcript_44740/m.104242 type:complete len:197 (+) Transcript_44740:53-643(+)